VAERIKLTDCKTEKCYNADFDMLGGDSGGIITISKGRDKDGYGFLPLSKDELDDVLKQILDNQLKLDKITIYARKLVYANPAISWQLKQLLRDDAPKTVRYEITCLKCDLKMEWSKPSLDVIKEALEEYLENNKAKLDCIHDYQYELIDQN